MTFEVQHKPGYRLKLRMGIHSGACVAGVVGTKIPHYSVFGETVEIAGLMEATGQAMKIQVSNLVALKMCFGKQCNRKMSCHVHFSRSLHCAADFFVLGCSLLSTWTCYLDFF